MTGYDNFHSTMVAFLKVVLPLLALGILSTLFLVSRTIDPNDAIPYAQVDIEDRVREPRLTLPTWAGVTDDGAALSVKAVEARPGSDAQGASAKTLFVVLETPDGSRTEMVAARGSLDAPGAILTVEGNVIITTSNGYQIESDAMTAALDRTGIISEGPVAAQGPLGKITSGAMILSEKVDERGSYLLVFNKGVKLIYDPKQ